MMILQHHYLRKHTSWFRFCSWTCWCWISLLLSWQTHMSWSSQTLSNLTTKRSTILLFSLRFSSSGSDQIDSCLSRRTRKTSNNIFTTPNTLTRQTLTNGSVNLRKLLTTLKSHLTTSTRSLTRLRTRMLRIPSRPKSSITILKTTSKRSESPIKSTRVNPWLRSIS